MKIFQRKEPVAAAAISGGGLLLVAGSLLNWTSVALNREAGRGAGRIADRLGGRGGGRLGGGSPFSANGIDLFAGKAALIAGVVLAMAGLAVWLARDWKVRRAFAVAATAAGAASAAFVLDRVVTGPLALGPRAPQLAFLSRSLDVGIWLALGGALIALAGGAVTAIFSEPIAIPSPVEAADPTPAGVPPSPAGPAAGTAPNEPRATEPLPAPGATLPAPPPPGRIGPEPEGSPA